MKGALDEGCGRPRIMNAARSNPVTGLDLARHARANMLAARERSIDDIINAAADMFAEHGYDNVTFDDVAQAVGMPRRTLYRRFKQKDEFLIRWTMRMADQICAGLALQPGDVRGLEVFRRIFLEIDEFRGAALKRHIQVQGIVARSSSATSAMATAALLWEEEIIAAFKAREERHWHGNHRACLVIPRIALVALRTTIETWGRLPARQATRPAFLRELNAVFDSIERTI